MMPTPTVRRLALPSIRQKWLGVPVTEFTGDIAQIARKIPRFSRVPFALNSDGSPCKENPYLDMIIQEPTNGPATRVPIGVVSKSYTLLQHRSVFERAVNAIRAAKVDVDKIRVDLTLTDHGERMALQFLFPDEFSTTPRDGRKLSLRLYCINSVDGSHVFDASLGWFRLVCSNGLIIGTIKGRFKKAHTEFLDINKIDEFLKAGIAGATLDRWRLMRWESTKIREDVFRRWVDESLKSAWGVKAATRAYHIARYGFDVELPVPFEKALPSQRTVKRAAKVPGAEFDDLNAFGISQALSWLAKERRELQEHLNRERQIRPLIKRLIALN
ncbi:MAG TPA: DUF932 domain-containing protein [Candidatus Udaeobacter sp.]